MTDEKQDNSSVPGSGAGDAAPTQEIPRIPKPVKRAPAKKAPSSKSPAQRSSAPTSQTDKGRTRPTPPAAPKPVSPMSSPTSSTPASTTAPVNGASHQATDKKSPAQPGGPQSGGAQPGGAQSGKTLTAADYARTTSGSAATTAVIPAVKDSGEAKRPSLKPQVTVEPAVQPGSGRRASLRLVRVEPWSVTRLAFAISVALMIVGVVAVTIFWVVLDITGVWDQINGSVTSVLSDDSSGFDITDYLGFGRLVGLTLVLSAINVILSTVLATIGAHLYNRAAQLLGGVEVTFSEQK